MNYKARNQKLFYLPTLIASLSLSLVGAAMGQTLTTLHNFTATTFPVPPYTNIDGADPSSALILSGNTLYGTAYAGGIFGAGTVFGLNTNGQDFVALYSFSQVFPPC